MKEKIQVPGEETETVINYSKAQVGEFAEVYTTDKVVMKRYEKFAKKYPDKCTVIGDNQYSMTFSVHPRCVGIYPRAPRRLSEEQRMAAATRLHNSRNM